MFIQKCFDEAPAHLAFGLLPPKLAKVARFWVPEHLRESAFGGAQMAKLAELVNHGVKVGQHGVVDLFVQTVACKGPEQGFEVLLPTRILAGKSAKYLFKAFLLCFSFGFVPVAWLCPPLPLPSRRCSGNH